MSIKTRTIKCLFHYCMHIAKVVHSYYFAYNFQHFFRGGGIHPCCDVYFENHPQYIPRDPSSARTGFFQLFSKLIMDRERIQSSSATRFTPVSRFPASLILISSTLFRGKGGREVLSKRTIFKIPFI